MRRPLFALVLVLALAASAFVDPPGQDDDIPHTAATLQLDGACDDDKDDRSDLSDRDQEDDDLPSSLDDLDDDGDGGPTRSDAQGKTDPHMRDNPGNG